MYKLKTYSIFFLSALVFLICDTAEARFSFRFDTLDVGDEAPQFVMRDLITNNAVFLRDYTGKTLREPWKKKERQVVVLSFWATWCQPCMNEISILTKLAENYKDQQVKIFLINTLERAESTEDSVRDEYKKRDYTLPCLIDPSGRYAGRYSIRGLPFLVVIDKFGVVRKINRGNHENFEVELEKMINELLGEAEHISK